MGIAFCFGNVFYFYLNIMSKEIENHITEAFQIKQFLGSGAYGHVWKVIHKQSGRQYALKKIFDAFQNDVDAQRTYRQVSILHQLDHQNIVKMEWVIKAHNGRDLYLVFEIMESDLHYVIGQGILTSAHIRFVTYQICKVLKYIHSAQLIHRDLKSSNILINSMCQIKLCDFGLVRSLTYEEESQLMLSEDVATRWYRSPEMLLGCKQYGCPTDMWSLGCILAEMVMGQPLFPGSSSLEQLQKILQFTGIPSSEVLKKLNNELGAAFVNELNIRKRPFKNYFPQIDSQLKELILKMLDFDPTTRLTAEQALQLPCLQQFRKSKQRKCQKFIVIELDDNKRLDVDQYRKIIFKDIERRYPSFNKITPMPRIHRSFHSLVAKTPIHPLAKQSSNSLIKLQNSTSLFHKSYLATTVTETGSVHIYKKQPRSLVSIHKGSKENIFRNVKETIKEEPQTLATKIFKRKARRNLWKKGQM